MSINFQRLRLKIQNSELLSGSFWTIIGSGASRVLLVIGSIITANVLGVEKYGEFGIIRSTINTVLVISGLNVGTVITKYISEWKVAGLINNDKNLTNVVQNYLFVSFLTLVLSVLVFVFAENISTELLEIPNLANELRLSSSIFLFGILFPLNESIYRGLQNFKRLGVLQVTGSITFVVFVPLGAYYYDVHGAILGLLTYVVSMFLITTFDLFFLVSFKNVRQFIFSKSLIKFSELSKLTLPVLLASLIDAPFFWFAQVILIKFAGIEANGIASAILQLRNLALIVPGYVSLAVLPILSRSISSNNSFDYKKGLKNSLKLNLLITVILIAPLIIFPFEILSLFGSDFKIQTNYWESFLAYISIPFLVLSNIYNQAIIAKNMGWTSLLIAIIWNTIFLGSAYFFIKSLSMGVTGYMLSLLIAIIVQTILRYAFEKRN